MKQILLITDGCSNVGISPVVAAAHARSQGLVVNVIGVVDEGELGEQGASEIAEIARAGGGMSRMVSTDVLSQTVQMMTRKTVVQTIQLAVQKELRQVLGTGTTLEALPPERRGAVVQVIDDLSETSALRVALLIDTSASMKSKLRSVEEACRDLLVSLRARKGKSEMAVLHFPGNTDADELAGWTDDLAKLNNLFYKLIMKGTTPTGPALMKAAGYLIGNEIPAEDVSSLGRREPLRTGRTSSGSGIWSDYVV